MAKKMKAPFKGHAIPFGGMVSGNGVKHKTEDKAAKSRGSKKVSK